jgi:hypothetical protein
MVIAFNIITNQSQGNGVRAAGGENWSGFFNDDQIFVVSVQGHQDDVDSHAHVGIVQTLLSSTRTGIYTGGVGDDVELHIQPRDGPPTLDADQTTRPWYNSACDAKPITTASQTLTMIDAPLPQIAAKVQNINDTTKIKNINSFKVEEHFLLTLLRYDGVNPPEDWVNGSTALAQWEWGYSFTLGPGAHRPVVESSAASQANLLDAPNIGRVIFTGEVATTEPVRKLSVPDGWQMYYT